MLLGRIPESSVYIAGVGEGVRWPTRQTPSQGLGRERAEINTRLSPLVAPGFFAWHRARAGLGILYALPITAL